MSITTVLIRSAFSAALLVGATAMASGSDYGELRANSHDVQATQWPDNLASLKVSFFADPHVGSAFTSQSDLDALVKSINRQKADVIIGGGDYIVAALYFKGETDFDIEDIANSLAQLKARDGVYFVLGNHDEVMSRDMAKFRTILGNSGITVLENEAAVIERSDGSQYCVAGVRDKSVGTTIDDITRTLNGVPENCPTLLVTHDPSLFKDISKEQTSRIAFMMAGHTHCGQISAVAYAANFFHKIPAKFHGGRFTHEGSEGIVTCGTGLSSVDYRDIPPQYEVLKIR
tara:strand:- start:165 stop:1028 length:864 start_codon:yes stop_codon:yes gene_type:complete